MLQPAPAFRELECRSHQIYFVHDFALRNSDQGPSVHQLSRKFGCKGSRGKAAWDNELNDPKVRGRHFAFNNDSEIEMLERVQTQAEKYALVTRTDFRHYGKVKCSRFIFRGWVDSFILRHIADFIETTSATQENSRLEIPRAFPSETTRCIREHVRRMKAELVLNLDEVGMSE
jgi:hypothetical protein